MARKSQASGNTAPPEIIESKILLISRKGLAQRSENLEHKFKEHNKNFVIVFEAIKKLLEAPVKPKNPIGFHPSKRSQIC